MLAHPSSPCTQAASWSLPHLFLPHRSSCSFLWLREAEASPEPWPPSTAKQLASITPDSSRAIAQPSPQPQSGSVPFPFMVKLKESKEREGNRFLAGQRVREPQSASPLTRDPQPSSFSSTTHCAPNPPPLLLIPALLPLLPPSHPGGDFPLGRRPTVWV